MTNLEIVLIVMLWVIYGVYHGEKWTLSEHSLDGVTEYILSILVAPICLLIRAIRGMLWV